LNIKLAYEDSPARRLQGDGDGDGDGDGGWDDDDDNGVEQEINPCNKEDPKTNPTGSSDMCVSSGGVGNGYDWRTGPCTGKMGAAICEKIPIGGTCVTLTHTCACIADHCSLRVYALMSYTLYCVSHLVYTFQVQTTDPLLHCPRHHPHRHLHLHPYHRPLPPRPLPCPSLSATQPRDAMSVVSAAVSTSLMAIPALNA
jgi:hypothetical protein